MEVEDIFEEWDDSNLMDMVEISEALDNGENECDECEKSDESEEEAHSESEDENVDLLRCKKCRKIYRSKKWFAKHQSTCDGSAKKKRGKHRPMSQHQIKTREVLAGLGALEYFRNDGLLTVSKLLDGISTTSSDVVSFRGVRYANLKLQGTKLRTELENIQGSPSTFSEFLKSITQKLWAIIFALDFRASSAARQKYTQAAQACAVLCLLYFVFIFSFILPYSFK